MVVVVRGRGVAEAQAGDFAHFQSLLHWRLACPAIGPDVECRPLVALADAVNLGLYSGEQTEALAPPLETESTADGRQRDRDGDDSRDVSGAKGLSQGQ